MLVVSRNVLQKLLCNSFIREHEERETFHWVTSTWRAFVVRGLGMIPLVEDCEQESIQPKAAFELLRVRNCLRTHPTMFKFM